MQKYSLLISERLKKTEALLVYAAIRGEFPGRASAFFRTSEAIEGGFRPHLSILGFHAEEILQSRDGTVTIENKAGKSTLNGNPFAIIEARMKECRVTLQKEYPYFQGGALGYFGYDSVRFLEPVLQKSKNSRLQTGTFDAELVFFRDYLVFDHTEERVLYYSTDAAEMSSRLARIESLAEHCNRAETSDSKTSFVTEGDVPEIGVEKMTSSFGKEKFLGAVKTLKHHIREGDIFQTVISEKFSYPFQGDAFKLFINLTEVNPAPYHFYFSIDDRVYLGASPEMLLKADQLLIETHPIAGTRPRGKDAEDEKRQEQQLLSSVKERAEHLMLVDLARNDIGRVATPGSVKVASFMKLRKFGGVMHLVSRVNGQKSAQMESLNAFGSCFPAGTLSGAPKIRAMQLISELEPAPRGFYGGAFIAASVTGDLDSCIAIRSMVVENGNVAIQAGAGIVTDSNPEKEYEEICHKSRLARRALALTLAQAKAEA
ncbi:MAG: anthranilate synthase component I family protein [Bdellovibrionales bacterium]|nr:anthranilate synthase component I family protein [Oligoflexia bacterium]